MQKRGQAAVEFLTTYGWAILILVGVAGAIIGGSISQGRGIEPLSPPQYHVL